VQKGIYMNYEQQTVWGILSDSKTWQFNDLVSLRSFTPTQPFLDPVMKTAFLLLIIAGVTRLL
jgi:hypothetical protein